MDLYLKLLRRSFPGVDLEITENWRFDHKKDLEYNGYTLHISGKPVKRFRDFRDMVECITYLAKDEIVIEEFSPR